MKHWVIKLIEGYQRSGGSKVWFGVECNFSPSCSEYTKVAIKRFGLRRGCHMGWRRIKRCNQRDCVHITHDAVPDHKDQGAVC